MTVAVEPSRDNDDVPDSPTRKRRTVDWAVLGYGVVVLAAMVAVIGPSNLSWSNSFVVTGPTVADPIVVPGDYVQVAYNVWLWYDGIFGGGHLPWMDPYLFGAQGGAMVQSFGWPLVLVTVPTTLVAGPVAAYNILIYLGFVLAAFLAAAWFRSLGISRLGAGAGGLAFALAPFRVAQGTGHATAILAWMFPLLLLCLERALRGDPSRARRWGIASVIVLVSILLSGEMHHAVFAALLTGGYVALRLPRAGRERLRRLVVPIVVGALGTAASAAILYVFVIGRSGAKEGRGMEEAAHYAPRLMDLVSPSVQALERYVYVGAVIGVLALVGAVVAIVANRRRHLAVVLLIGLLVCVWFSVAPAFVGHPTLQSTYRLVPFFSFSRVPGRLMIVGALFLAGLVALAFDVIGSRWKVGWLLVPFALALVIDLPLPRHNAVPDGGNPYYGLESGATILELPMPDPGDALGSLFSLNVMRHPGPRVGGYFVVVPEDRDLLRREADELESDLSDSCRWRDLTADAELDYVGVYRQMFRDPPEFDRWIATLRSLSGLREVQERDGVTTFRVVDPTFGCMETTS